MGKKSNIDYYLIFRWGDERNLKRLICPWSDSRTQAAYQSWSLFIPQTSYRLLTAFRDTDVAVFTQECLSFRTETSFSYSIARKLNKARVRGMYVSAMFLQWSRKQSSICRRPLCQIQGRKRISEVQQEDYIHRAD